MRSGWARRAPRAMGKALPIEPAGPLMSRVSASQPAWIHWPNSPPSATRIAPRSSQRRAHAERMNGRARLSAERVPLVGHEPARRRDQLAPGAPPPAHGAARIRQSLREQGRIRHHPQRDAAAAVERLGIPVRLHEPTGRGEGGRPPEAHREVEPLAQEQDEIRPFQIGRRHVKPRVVHPARALHGEGGDSRRRGEALDAPRARRA